MANNRIYLKCGSCGVQFMLAKRLAGPYHPGVDHEERFEKFLDLHGPCSLPGGFDVFSLVYESPPDYDANATMTEFVAAQVKKYEQT